MEDDNWDLHAVVRSCMNASTSSSSSSFINTTTTTTTANTTTTNQGSLVTDVFVLPPGFSSFTLKREDQDDIAVLARNNSETWNYNVGELQELYKPFLRKNEPTLMFQNTPSPTTSFSGPSSFDIHKNNKYMPLSKPQQQPTKPSHASSVRVSSSSASASQASRSKRKKSQVKRICQVPAESLSSDIWAWRKYGQKPIKGSPYPRGYYRCSSSKGCLARKQVERNGSDPEMFIVTYTAEHNHPPPTHRNSLAGSTRQKPIAATPDAAATREDNNNALSSPSSKPSCSSPASSAEEEGLPQSINSGSREDIEDTMMDDEEGEVELSDNDMALSDDFFEGIEGFVGDDREDCFLDRFPANFGLSWSAGGTGTAAAASNS